MDIADTMTQRGRGVIAGRDFRAGEVVEISPVIIREGADALLRNCDFDWRVPGKTACPGSSIAAGYGGMYSHADAA